MAMAKKTVSLPKEDAAVKTEAAVPANTGEVKETAVKADAQVKKEAAKKDTVKKETKTATRKAGAPKKEAEDSKDAAPKKAAGRKPAVKSEIHIQFSGKSYSNEDLIKIAKDVWKYDLQQNENDIADLELYVKPEENLVYYVINGEYSGSFGI